MSYTDAVDAMVAADPATWIDDDTLSGGQDATDYPPYRVHQGIDSLSSDAWHDYAASNGVDR